MFISKINHSCHFANLKEKHLSNHYIYKAQRKLTGSRSKAFQLLILSVSFKGGQNTLHDLSQSIDTPGQIFVGDEVHVKQNTHLKRYESF